MRKIILNLAISLDGRIVDENGKFDWIHGDSDKTNDTDLQFDFDDFSNSCDTLIFGKIAYDDIPFETMENFSQKKIIVLTHSRKKPGRANVEFFSGNLTCFLKNLKETPGSNVWVWGGASVCNILIKADLIDEYIIGIIPTIVGKGTRLFADDNPLLELHMKECTITEGIAMLRYTKKL